MPVFFFPNSCFVFALANTNVKRFGIKTDFQFYAALLTFLWKLIILFRPLQAWAFRTSDVRDYSFLPPDLPIFPWTSPTDLQGHISASTDLRTKYDLSICIYVSRGIHSFYQINIWRNKSVQKMRIIFMVIFSAVNWGGTWHSPRRTCPLHFKQVPGLSVYRKICSGLNCQLIPRFAYFSRAILVHTGRYTEFHLVLVQDSAT